MKLAEEYKKSLSEKWSIRLRTRHPDGDNYDGVVTQIKRGFVVLREERELDFDGIIILAKELSKAPATGNMSARLMRYSEKTMQYEKSARLAGLTAAKRCRTSQLS